MIVNIQDVWADAAADHIAYVKTEANKAVAKIVKKERDCMVRSSVLAFTRHFLSQLIDPAETQFAEPIACYEQLFPEGRRRERAKVLFEKIFNYERFKRKENFGKHWCAYDLCSKARFVVCPYCHLVTTGTQCPNPAKGIKGYRPELDHYHSQAKYPFLGLSLGNLIPVCDLCNGPKMKHDTDVAATPLLHPMAHDESVRFALGDHGDFENPLMWSLQGPDQAYRIEVMGHRNVSIAAQAITVFQLEGRYNERPVVSGVLNRMRELGREWDQSSQLFLFVAKRDYRALDNHGYRNELHGKLIRDLHEQLCVPLPMT